MSSIEEFKVIRLFRAYNTCIQMCLDRGYRICRPSAVANALSSSNGNKREIDYELFLSEFVIRPGATVAPRDKKRAKTDRADGSDSEEEEDRDAWQLARARAAATASAQWMALRYRMTLVCARPAAVSGAEETPAARKARRNALLVFFSDTPTLQVKEVRELRDIALQRAASAMVIVSAKIPSLALREMKELSGRLDLGSGQEMLLLQGFEEDALSVNVAEHATSSTHVAMTPEETQAFLTERKLNISQLPRIMESDPIVRYLGLQRGQVVRIVRQSENSGPYDMYRQVI